LENENAWRNPIDPLDVDSSGVVSSLDALIVINQLNRGTTGVLVDPSLNGRLPDRYYDTNGNSEVTAIDALLVINAIGQNDQINGEQVLWASVTSPIDLEDSVGETDDLAIVEEGLLPRKLASVLAADALFAQHHEGDSLCRVDPVEQAIKPVDRRIGLFADPTFLSTLI
jgi:hypothetical protein